MWVTYLLQIHIITFSHKIVIHNNHASVNNNIAAGNQPNADSSDTNADDKLQLLFSLIKEIITMASSNKKLVPEAKEALNRFKMEAASEEDVPIPS